MMKGSDAQHSQVRLLAVPLLVASLAGTSFAREQRSSTQSGTQSSATDLSLPPRHPASLRSERLQVEMRPTLHPEVSGVRLSVGSKCTELLRTLDSFWSRGAVAPSDKVAQFLQLVSKEAGTVIQPDRFGLILRQNPTLEVNRAFLQFHLECPLVGIPLAGIDELLKFKDPEIIALALRCRAEHVGTKTPREFFAPYEKHPSPEVRYACAVAMMASGHEPPQLTPFECLQTSKLLDLDHHSVGLEGKLAIYMTKSLYPPELARGKVGEVSPNDTTALLHLLQRLDQAFPGYFEAVHKFNKEYFNQIARSLLILLKEEQAKLLDRELLSPQAQGIAALHFESHFSPMYAKSLFEALSSEDLVVVKAGRRPDGSHGEDCKPVEEIPDSSYRTDYLAELEKCCSATPRESYLSELSNRVVDRSRPLFILHSMHGGPNHSWFYQGVPGRDNSSDLDTPLAISHRILAENLFKAVDTSAGELDLGHVVLVLEACRQYTVAQETLARLQELAARAQVKITAYPTIVAVSQPFTYASVKTTSIILRPSEPGEEKVIPKEGLKIADHLYSSVLESFVIAAERQKSVRVRDLFAADEEAAAKYFDKLANPKSLLSSHIKLDEKQRVRGKQEQEAQESGPVEITGINNPAIFGGLPISLRQLLHRAREKIRASAPGCPELPGSDGSETAEMWTFLELF